MDILLSTRLASSVTQRRTHNLLRMCATASLRIWRNRHGQDLIEYSLMAGFVAVAAGAIMPNVGTTISTIFSKVGSVLNLA